ncbi:MAG: arylsulfatase A-like enzyme [Rhodothermales bacterium]|jgi:arylsulfatase A-like enzyme
MARLAERVLFAAAAALVLFGCGSGESPAARPNIVLVYVDDMGWRDMAVQGSDYYLTPHMDQLASEGVRFRQAYSNAPNCAPSRASLLSGRYGPRHGVYTVGSSERGASRNRALIPVKNRTVLDTSFVTLAEGLSAAGYTNGFFGKWHLGAEGFGPTDQGFDRAEGWSEAGSPPGYYWPYQRGRLSLPGLAEEGRAGEHLTDRLVDEALDFMHQTEGPFFVMLSHYAVHTPIQADSSRVGRFRDRRPVGGHQSDAYASMIAGVDDGLGRIRDALVEMGVAHNTYIVLASDNGGFGPITDMLPLRGAKGMLYEGGVRVPMIVTGPGVKPRLDDTPVIGMDLYPTFLEWAGYSKPAWTDGLSLARLISAGEPVVERSLFWHFPAYLEATGDMEELWRTTPASSIRRGSHKLLRFYETGTTELYDLSAEPGEQTLLQDPDVQRLLEGELAAWLSATDAFIPTQANPDYVPAR